MLHFKYNKRCDSFDKISTGATIATAVLLLVATVLFIIDESFKPVFNTIAVVWWVKLFLEGALYHYKAKVITLPVDVEFKIRYGDATAETKRAIKFATADAYDLILALQYKALFEKKSSLIIIGSIQMVFGIVVILSSLL